MKNLVMKRLVGFLRLHWHRLVQLHDTPHRIAGGTAIGVFFGFTPFFGVKTLLAILGAWGFRCSRIAAAIGVTLHDVIIPLMPVLLRAEYGIGYWLLNSHQWPNKFRVEQLKIQEWLHWKVLHQVIWPTFVGSLVIGIPLAVLCFGVTLRVVRHQRAKRLAADAAALDINEIG